MRLIMRFFTMKCSPSWRLWGVVELLLAERVVSLWWRLRRAERMQSQVIEDMIGREIANDPARRKREYYHINQGIYPGDPRMELDDLPLGRIAISDWSNCKVLDRMLMYERRIESSLNRAMKELKRFQTIRRIEWQNAAQRKNKSFFKDPFLAEAVTRFSSEENHGDLKKQTQFVLGLMGLTSFMNGSYGDISIGVDEENKANRSQFQTDRRLRGALRLGSELALRN